jgi:hypothetical protein
MRWKSTGGLKRRVISAHRGDPGARTEGVNHNGTSDAHAQSHARDSTQMRRIQMPDTPVKLHMGPQEAAALLDPIRLELARLETRIARFLERAELIATDSATLSSARSAVNGALAEISRLQAEARR